MSRGTPDGRIETNQFAAQISDTAHVSNMLWGFSPIDGRGRAVYLDTFNNGLVGFGISTSGAGASLPALASLTGGGNNDIVFSPPNSCKLDPGVTSNSRSFIFRELFMGKTQRVGLEFAVSKINTSADIQAQVDYAPIGFSPWLGVIRFDEFINSWRVWRGGGVWTTFYNPGVSPSNRMHIQVKIVMDFSTGYYSHAYVGDQFFDLSTLTMGGSSSSYAGYFVNNVTSISRGAGTTPIYIGYVLITKDEP